MNSSSSAPNACDRLAEVRQHEQQARRAILDRLVEQHELVLPEHALGEVAEHDADLGAQHDPHPDLDRRLERPEVLGRALEHRVEQEPHRVDVARHPFAAADALGRRQRPGRLESGVGDHARLGLRRQRGQVGGRLARRGRWAPFGHERGDPLGDDPVDHAGILSSSRSVSGERAAITGELGSAVSGAPSG